MRKFISSLLAAVMIIALPVIALAGTVYIGVDVEEVASPDADKTVGELEVKVNETTAVEETNISESGTIPDVPITAEANSDEVVSVNFEPEEGYTVDSVSAYYRPDSPQYLDVTAAGNNTWTFTMVDEEIVVVDIDVKPAPTATLAPTKAPASTPGNILPPSPAYNPSTPVEEPQSAVAGTVAPTPMKSVLPAGTVSFSGGATIGTNIKALDGLTKNLTEKFSATVLNLEARDLSNQNGLAAYYAAIEGKEAEILATYGVYASKDLSAEDNGKLTTLTWKNITAEKLDKNTKIKAVCYNLVDGTYTIEGEIDEFGNILLKNFIIRPTKTNITVFICK